jgi:iduronate 2-sulfatase
MAQGLPGAGRWRASSGSQPLRPPLSLSGTPTVRAAKATASRDHRVRNTMVHTVCALVLLFLGASGAASAKQKNVLFFAVDDLRPEINAFDPDISVPGTTHAKMFTPNIDALAHKSLVLRKNYCQQAICGPTRASLLTSRRPDRTKVWDLSSYWRKVGGNFTTIPQLFRQHGYETVGMGKIFHPGTASGGVKGHNLPGHGGGDDQLYSWSRPYWHAPNLNFWGGKHPAGAGVRPFHPGVSVLPVPAEIEANHPLPDTQIAERAVDTLAGFLQPGNLSEGQRFFLGVGFHRPVRCWGVPPVL